MPPQNGLVLVHFCIILWRNAKIMGPKRVLSFWIYHGGVSAGHAPPFSFKKKTGRARSKRKPSAPKCHRHLGEKRGPSESVQSEIGALVPSAPYSGHQPTASPHNRCDTKSWWSSKGLSANSRAFRFATRCRVRTRQRQRKEKRSHAITAPVMIGPPYAGTGL